MGRTSILVGLLATAWGVQACSDDAPQPTASTESGPAADAAQSAVRPDDQMARELAAAHFDENSYGAALEALKPLLERDDASLEDLCSGAAIQMQYGDFDAAKLLLERAQKTGRSSATLEFLLGRWALFAADMPGAVQHFLRAHELAPEDVPTTINLVNALELSNREAEAMALLIELEALGVDRLGSWYLTVSFKLGRIMISQGKDEEGLAWLTLRQELVARGVPEPNSNDIDLGTFGRVLPPPPRSFETPSALGPAPSFAAARLVLPELAGCRLETCDLDNDGRMDLVGFGPRLAIGVRAADGTWTAQVIDSAPAPVAVALDLGNDDDLDLAWIDAENKLRLALASRATEGTPLEWKAVAKELPALPAGAARDLIALDFDHEGDLDLACVGEFGLRLWRNDGAEQAEGTFTDVTAEAGLPRERRASWIEFEDLDTDQAIDLVFGDASGSSWARSLRGGKFEDWSARLAGFKASIHPPIEDFDDDSRPDLFELGAVGARLLLGRPSTNLEARALAVELAGNCSRTRVVDLDLDGFKDVLLFGRAGDGKPLAQLVRAPAWPLAGQAIALPLPFDPSSVDVVAGEFDDDLKPDLAVSSDRGVELFLGQGPTGNAVRLGFRGTKDNRRGVGTTLEQKSRRHYQRWMWRGEAKLVGVGKETRVAWRRLTWPNGVRQWDLEPGLGDRTQEKDALGGLAQASRLGASCPFLYTFDGQRFVFVSDVLGITPLGLPMAPGMLVPPDHDEYVLVRGDQLRPNAQGEYELAFTEELREVTYLDRLRLEVVDHPAGTEIFPNELFCFPPFPEAHTHTLRDPLSPLQALGSDGQDWTAALARIDDVYAVPFEPVPVQFLGLATPHFLELSFDRERVASAAKLRLFLTGWFYWTDASVNLASARDPAQEFVPPIFQVPDGKGGWVDAGPPVGFPAGKTKTMVVDVGAMLRREDPRLRIFSTLRLYWDAIRLATDGDDAELVTTSIEPRSAVLWRRGFSAPEISEDPSQPERFEWERLAEFPRWNPHPGLYTAYGESLELVTAIDDRFVVMASGDALTVRFDASEAPPLKKGFVRDYLVFLDGWAKDRDPNTVEALYVEPLPFHGMSGYPYGPNERFPDDALHREWRRKWLVRPGQDWILPFGAELDQRKPSNAAIAPRN